MIPKKYRSGYRLMKKSIGWSQKCRKNDQNTETTRDITKRKKNRPATQAKTQQIKFILGDEQGGQRIKIIYAKFMSDKN